MSGWQVPGFLEETNGRLHVDRVDTVALAQQYGTPLFVFSEARIRHNCAILDQAFQQGVYETQIFYASKANSNLAVLEIVRDAGLNVEVNSGGELYKALTAGFRPEQIIFNGVAKTEQELREAIRQGIYCINVDSAYELARIRQVAREEKRRAQIALRLVPEVETGVHGGLVTGTQKSKFGLSQSELPAVYREALADDAHLHVLGLHVHLGAQTTDGGKFRAGFAALLAQAAALHALEKRPFAILNLGGGLPVPFVKSGDGLLQGQIASDPQHPLGNLYGMLRAGLSPAEVAQETIGTLAGGYFDEMLDGLSPGFRATLRDTRFILEPGSRVVADSAVLLTRIQNYKTRASVNESWLLLDAGFNTLLDTFAYNWYYHVIAANRAAAETSALYRMGGPLCDSGDTYHDSEALGRLPDTYALPEGLAPGDLLAFFDVGGYTLEQMCQYNGQPRAAAVLVRASGDVQLMRRRDSYADLAAHDLPL